MDNCDMDEKLWDFLTGDACEDVCAEIDRWRIENAENEVYFMEFQRDFLYMRWTFRRKLIRRDHFGDIRQHISRRVMWRRMMRVVASVVVVLGAGILAWIVWPLQRQELPVAEVADIQPGKSQATLILSSGSEIPIAAVNAELREQDGTTIKVDDRGKILYTNNKTAWPDKEIMNRLVIPRGGEFAMVLSDGTRVWLNSATELKYPTKFVGTTRTVYLKGEAYFDVKPDAEHPFIVLVNQEVEVKVFGTEFNVNTYTSGKVETVLVEGSVGVKSGKKAVKLVPGEKADYMEGNPDICVEKVDVIPYVAWKDGNFVFQNERLEQIMEKLSLWYDVEVFYTANDLKEIRLSGDMKRYEEICDLLYFLEKSSAVKFKIQNRTIIIDKP